jgi:hypothetical protein
MSDAKSLGFNESPILNALEIEALEKSKDLWNALVLLEKKHPDDLNDLRFHIHAIQNIILARPWLCIKKLNND